MALDLNAFRSMISSAGLAVPNRYDVRIPTGALAQGSNDIFDLNNAVLEFSDEATDWMASYFSSDMQAMGLELTAYCEKSELPSYQFQMETQRHYGPSFKIPHMPEYQDITMTFLCGRDMLERKFFDAWMYMIMDPETNNFNYINEYAVDIDILQYPDSADSGGGGVVSSNYFTTLVEAFPIAIAAQELAYESNNTIQKISVTFTYKFAIPFNGKAAGSSTDIRGNNQYKFTSTINGGVAAPSVQS